MPKKYQYYLSHLWDIVLEKTSSDYNKELSVSLSRGRLRLDTANATYSYEDLYRAFYQSFQHLNLPQKTIKNVLVLGLGLGSIPHMLEENFHQNAHYTAVEIDKVVIQLAQKYLPVSIKNKISMVEADAWEFVMAFDTENTFDLITIDIFIDHHLPISFKEPIFLRKIKKILQKEGILLFNHLANDQNLVQSPQNYYNQVFSTTFQNSQLLDLDGNLMMIAQK